MAAFVCETSLVQLTSRDCWSGATVAWGDSASIRNNEDAYMRAGLELSEGIEDVPEEGADLHELCCGAGERGGSV